jgi:hypothetical protein
VCERAVKCLLDNELEDVGFADPDQHGFSKGRSCSTNLLESRDDWTGLLDNGNPVDVVYTDISDAFGSVDYQLLAHELLDIGLSAELINFITAFYSGRRQRVVVDGYHFGWVSLWLTGITLTGWR